MGSDSIRRSILLVILIGAFGMALASPALAFRIEFSAADLAPSDILPAFSTVRSFDFDIDVQGPFVVGASYDNDSIELVQYDLAGSLDATPSGFPAFALRRIPGFEGPISPSDWIEQGSSIAFEIAASANLNDGLLLSELVPDVNGLLFALDAREFERLDRARYHPPQLLLYADGTGLLRNSNNSSGSTGTTNPGNGMTVDVDFGEEFITNLRFDPDEILLVVPEPGTGILLGLGLAMLTARRERKGALRGE